MKTLTLLFAIAILTACQSPTELPYPVEPFDCSGVWTSYAKTDNNAIALNITKQTEKFAVCVYATADTLVIEMYSYTKLAYTTQMIGLRDISTDYLEADLTTVIIPANTAKKFEINEDRPGQIRVRPKTLTGRTTMKTKRVSFIGVNE